MKIFSIGEIAEQVGVATSTIRYYEQIGLLPPAQRINTKRRYDETILPKLRLVVMARHAGLSIAEIQTLFHDFPVDTPPSKRWQVVATQKIIELNEMIKQAQAMKLMLEQTLQCHCGTIEDCANNAGVSDASRLTDNFC